MTLKDDLHQLVDSLDEGRAQEALAYLQQLQARPNAPIADLPETAQVPLVVLESKDELGGDELITADEATRRIQGSGA